MVKAFILALLGLVAAVSGFLTSSHAQERVDVELVIAVDVSDSMGLTELHQQRAGYVAAFRSADVISAIREGRLGRVAVTYVEWARADRKKIIVPWTIIDGEEASLDFAERLQRALIANMRRTSIAGAIRYGIEALAANGIVADRQVIDISGDGPNNEGGPVTEARDAAIAQGVTVNGLPLMIQPWYPGIALGAPDLGQYYKQCVIGGDNAFVVPVRSWDEFPGAVRHKLILELAGQPARVIRASELKLLIEPEVDCMIGEKARADFERRYP